jgi:hypothetical protein
MFFWLTGSQTVLAYSTAAFTVFVQSFKFLWAPYIKLTFRMQFFGLRRTRTIYTCRSTQATFVMLLMYILGQLPSLIGDDCTIFTEHLHEKILLKISVKKFFIIKIYTFLCFHWEKNKTTYSMNIQISFSEIIYNCSLLRQTCDGWSPFKLGLKTHQLINIAAITINKICKIHIQK